MKIPCQMTSLRTVRCEAAQEKFGPQCSVGGGLCWAKGEGLGEKIMAIFLLYVDSPRLFLSVLRLELHNPESLAKSDIHLFVEGRKATYGSIEKRGRPIFRGGGINHRRW